MTLPGATPHRLAPDYLEDLGTALMISAQWTGAMPHLRVETVPGSVDDLAALLPEDAVVRFDQRFDRYRTLCAELPGLILEVEQRRNVTRLRAVGGSVAAVESLMAQLTAAAGPLPSTPGQAQSAAALSAERHALEMLARSERSGVGLGAAAALVLDWQALRAILTQAAERFGVTLPPSSLPDMEATAAALDASPAAERAIAFGAQQLFAQHRELLGLLEARSSARGE